MTDLDIYMLFALLAWPRLCWLFSKLAILRINADLETQNAAVWSACVNPAETPNLEVQPCITD